MFWVSEGMDNLNLIRSFSSLYWKPSCRRGDRQTSGRALSAERADSVAMWRLWKASEPERWPEETHRGNAPQPLFALSPLCSCLQNKTPSTTPPQNCTWAFNEVALCWQIKNWKYLCLKLYCVKWGGIKRWILKYKWALFWEFHEYDNKTR